MKGQDRGGGGGAEPGLRGRGPPGRDGQFEFCQPAHPESFWQLKESVRGLARPAAFNIP